MNPCTNNASAVPVWRDLYTLVCLVTTDTLLDLQEGRLCCCNKAQHLLRFSKNCWPEDGNKKTNDALNFLAYWFCSLFYIG